MTIHDRKAVATINSESSLRTQIGVDIGGTFTDIVLERPDGQRYSTKVLTTHKAPEEAVIVGIQAVLTQAGVFPQDIGLVVHGTTLATNALIERRGARTALLTTAGFRDVIETRSEERFEQYDLTIDLPQPLVPRKWRFPISERLDADGNVLTALDEAAIEHVARELKADGIEAVAIGFLHSYRYPRHEQRAGELLQALLPELWITLSSDVSPEMREYERFSTACANAYVQPMMASYLARLQQRLADCDLTAPLRLILSGGGLTTVDTARRFPVRLVESGPAGGALFASHIAKQLQLPRVLSFDMGGTTAKICLIDNQTPLKSRSFEVARVYRFKKGSGLPLRIPVIEMVEIGAGGGSIASIDSLGRIKVGPESAGSEPGPACYGRGGDRPAVTDADLALGRLDPNSFAGGTVVLDSHASKQALEKHICKAQSLNPELAAWAIGQIVEENMASAARVHAIESGMALSDRTLIAFGGAAPLHALHMAEKIGVRRVIIPSAAGVGSAVGFLKAPLSFEIARSHHTLLSGLNLPQTLSMLEEIADEASRIVRETSGHDRIEITRHAFMRYAGQGHEISIPATFFTGAGDDVPRLRSMFESEYARVYGRSVAAAEVELLSWVVTAIAEHATFSELRQPARIRCPEAQDERQIFNPEAGGWIAVPVYDRDLLYPGDLIEGPAVITERETSTLVTAAFSARINEWGYIDCTRKPQ